MKHILAVILSIPLWYLIFLFLSGCTKRFTIGNGAYIQNIKIESRECSNFNGIKLCPKENI
jgi:hypothetical protein